MLPHPLKKTPPRLPTVFSHYGAPLYFVTINTLHRRPILNSESVFSAFLTYAETNAPHGRCIGRFVIMPDHIHFFVRISAESRLRDFVRLMKQFIGKSIPEKTVGSPWQPGFFDHLLRNAESYTEKWNYVRMNPVRAGLANSPSDWRWQGEAVRLEHS